MVTYDTDDLVDELYAPTEDWAIIVDEIIVEYSAATARNVASERLVLGPGMKMLSISHGSWLRPYDPFRWAQTASQHRRYQASEW